MKEVLGLPNWSIPLFLFFMFFLGNCSGFCFGFGAAGG